MKHKSHLPLLALTASLVLPVAGLASEFNTVDADQSTLVFRYKQMNVAMEGRFKKFAVHLNFDPAKADDGRVSLDVDLASIDTGFPEGDEEVAGKQWFNIKAFPTAHFASSGVKALGNNRFEVTGPLSIKGRTQMVTAPVALTIHGGAATFEGAFVVKRGDFAIGEGAWADFGTLANEIQVRFHLLAGSAQ